MQYYANREKMRVIGREGDHSELNRKALQIAREVADETGTVLKTRTIYPARILW